MKNIYFVDYFLGITIITIILGIIYATVQQSYRSNANDPQIEIARDINSKLRRGNPIEKFFTDTIDIDESLSVFNVLYNGEGKPTRSSGLLRNEMPVMPKGVFESAKKNGEYQLTWQPEPGVRMAMVIVKSTSSSIKFIASGRSLQEIEVREYNLRTTILFGWIIIIAMTLLHSLLRFYNSEKTKSKTI